METTFPAKLEFTSLEIGGRLNDDINCSISLTKGLQNFGQIKFKINSQDTKFSFHEQKIINFSYTIRLTTRKDFFFHINLFDSHLNEQIGDFIGISCHMLAQTFQNDSTTVIQKSDEFVEGVILKYKIYRPQVQIKELNTISFKTIQKNDFISNLFAGPDLESNNLLASQLKLSRAEKSGHFSKKNPSNLKNSQAHMKKQRNQQQQGQSELLRKSKKQQLKKSVGKKQPHNQFFSFVFKKQSGFVEKKKKYQFYEKQNHHAHGLSKKLKTVIILLILGAVFLLVDSIADKFGTEQKKKHKKKSIKKEKIEHF